MCVGRPYSSIASIIVHYCHCVQEAFDYIGSSRTVYDILDNKIKPLTLESIDTFIEIGQLGLHSAEDTLYVHTDPRSRDKVGSIYNMIKCWSVIIKILCSMVMTVMKCHIHKK